MARFAMKMGCGVLIRRINGRCLYGSMSCEVLHADHGAGRHFQKRRVDSIIPSSSSFCGRGAGIE